MNPNSRPVSIIAFFCLSCILLQLDPHPGSTSPASPGPPKTESSSADAVPAILDLFERYRLVALGEHHDLREQFVLYDALISSSQFVERVGNLVVEAGNKRYQPLLDKYIAGEDIDRRELAVLWRNNTQGASSVETASFEGLLETVRERNRVLPREQKIKVFAADPPIDWSKIKSESDLNRFLSRRDAHYAKVVQTEILDRGKKALLIMGASHFYKTTPSGVVGRLEESNPGTIYTIYPLFGFGKLTDEIEPKLASWIPPLLIDLRDHWLGEIEAAPFLDITLVPSDPERERIAASLPKLPQGTVMEIDLPDSGQLQKWMLEQHAQLIASPKGQTSRRPKGDFFKSKTGRNPFSGLDMRNLFDGFLYFGPFQTLSVEPPKPTLALDDSYWRALDDKHRSLYGRPVAPWVREALRTPR